ncbi:MAG: hypothetical protein HOO96_31775 [Polyangiaceae bacterium]|nr:hypothetical protein [Polyangiaceae bacterium]
MDAEDWMVAVRMSVRSRDFDAIERLRGPLARECIDQLVHEYQRRTNWEEKSLLVFLMQDQRDPRQEPVMRDALGVPDSGDDVAWDVRIIAICQLEGRKARDLRGDYDLVLERVAALQNVP